MAEQNRGQLFVVTGPSGAGKGTVLGIVRARDPQLYYSISATTRAPRSGEQDGVHYFFRSREAFEEMIAQNRLLEYAEYVGNYYGTPLDPIEEARAQGRDVLLEIEVQGALQVKQRVPEAELVFIAPPRFSDLADRLRGRGSESEEVIARRLATAREEYGQSHHFDYLVVNPGGAPEQAAEELLAIITAQRCRMARRADVVHID